VVGPYRIGKTSRAHRSVRPCFLTMISRKSY